MILSELKLEKDTIDGLLRQMRAESRRAGEGGDLQCGAVMLAAALTIEVMWDTRERDVAAMIAEAKATTDDTAADVVDTPTNGVADSEHAAPPT